MLSQHCDPEQQQLPFNDHSKKMINNNIIYAWATGGTHLQPKRFFVCHILPRVYTSYFIWQRYLQMSTKKELFKYGVRVVRIVIIFAVTGIIINDVAISATLKVVVSSICCCCRKSPTLMRCSKSNFYVCTYVPTTSGCLLGVPQTLQNPPRGPATLLSAALSLVAISDDCTLDIVSSLFRSMSIRYTQKALELH
jgi:hypothetical protein